MSETIEQDIKYDLLVQRIKEGIAQHLRVDIKEVVPAARLADDLGVDSLDMIEFGIAAEDEFGIEITEEECEDIITVQDAIDYIDGKR